MVILISYLIGHSILALAAPAACPNDMVSTHLSCIDKYEGSIMLTDELNHDLAFHSPFLSLDGEKFFRAISQADVYPQAYISANQAEVACKNSGKRLCSSQEWLAGCKGKENKNYPYGKFHEPKTCNDYRATHPILELYNTQDSWVWSLEAMNNPLINQLNNSLLKSGESPLCLSSYGTFDQVGNLHEWVSDDLAKGRGIFRGGYYVDATTNGQGCNYKTTAHLKSYHDYSTGFRCCKDLSPTNP